MRCYAAVEFLAYAQTTMTTQSAFLESTSLSWEPHDYQRRAMKFMIERGVAGLFLDPGLGKTSITLGAFKLLKNQGIVSRMLVIAPLRVCHMVWPAEVSKWAQFKELRVEVLHGKDKDKALRRDADVYVINPEGLKWLLTPGNIKLLNAQMLVIDESTKFKRSSTQRFKLIKKWLGRFQRRYILTGTPAPNGLMDLFGQIYLLDEGTSLGRFITHYRQQYFEQSGYMGYDWRPRPEAHQQILDKIGHFTLRLEDKDYLTLPELIYDNIEVELPPEAQRHYRQLEDEFITFINGEEVTALNAGAASLKLRQFCNGGAYNEAGEAIFLHDAKTEALADLIEQLQGAPVLVFYQFKHDIKRLSHSFVKYCAEGSSVLPYIGSGVSPGQAAIWANMFNTGDLPLLLAHPASAGHGLNLQARSNHVVFFGPTWDLEHYDQGMRRVYRQGNPNTHVYVHHIVCKDTIDQVVMKALSGKDKTQRTLLEALKTAYQHKLDA